MTSEQYRLLLLDLARTAGLADPSGLLEFGRVMIGEVDAVLVHEPSYDEKLLQVRMRLGTLPAQGDELTRALLEANYVSGYGGECVFSLFPASNDVVITIRVRLVDAMTAQELWQSISDVARHGSKMWEELVGALPNSNAANPFDQRSAFGMQV